MARAAPPLGYQQNALLVDDLQSLSGWSNTGGNGSGSFELVQGGGPTPELPNFIRLTADAGGTQFRIKKDVSFPLFNGHFGFWIRVPGGASKVNAFRFFPWLSPHFGSGYYQLNWNASDFLDQLGARWQFVTYRIAQMNAVNPATNPPDLSAKVSNIYIGFDSLAGEDNVQVDFAGVWAGVRQRPKLIFSFDDSNDTDYTVAFPYLAARGIKATTYQIRDRIGTAGRLTEPQLEELQQAGWIIGSHGGPDLTTLSAQELDNEIAAAKDWNRTRGFSWEHYAYPLGKHNEATAKALRKKGFRTARLVDSTFRCAALGGANQALRWPGYGSSQSDLAGHKAFLDDVIRHGEFYEYYSHRIQPGGGAGHVDTAIWQGFVDYAVEQKDKGLLDIVTTKEAHDGIAGPRTGA